MMPLYAQGPTVELSTGYAVYTRSCSERVVHSCLLKQGIHSYLPLCRQRRSGAIGQLKSSCLCFRPTCLQT